MRNVGAVLLCTVVFSGEAAAALLSNAQYFIEITAPGVFQQLEMAHPFTFPTLENELGPMKYKVQATTSRNIAGAVLDLETLTDEPSLGIHLTALVSIDFQMRVNQKRPTPAAIHNVPILDRARAYTGCFDWNGVEPNQITELAGADVSVSGPGLSIRLTSSCPGDSGLKSIDNLREFYQVGETYNVHQFAWTDLVGSHVSTFPLEIGLARALADPTFQIDPAFEFADYFEIEYSPNYDPNLNVVVPEPSSAAMIGVASAALAYGLKRRNFRTA